MEQVECLHSLKGKAFEASSEGILITDEDGVLLAVNKKFEEITGYQASEVLGKTTRLLASEGLKEGLYQDRWNQLQEQGWWSGLLWKKHRTGDAYLEHLSVRAAYRNDGSVEGYIGIIRGVANQKFEGLFNTRPQQVMPLESDLRAAIAAGGHQFVLHYQPKINLETGRAVGLEALIRWHHPVLGLVPPGNFIPLAEEVHLINPLCRWLTNEVAGQIKRWGNEALPVSINISPIQFRQPHFVQELIDITQSHGVDASMIELEITEGVFINDKENAVLTLQAARNAGFRIALDDFGTGYSSLSYLVSLPIDVLKIDRTFIDDKDSACMAIVRFLVALGRELGVEVVAEGVETLDQAHYLYLAGCTVGQGYLFARPLPVADVLPYLHAAAKADEHALATGMELIHLSSVAHA